MNEQDRIVRLERAGYNVLHLDAGDLRWDFFTDIPPRAYVQQVVEAGVSACRRIDAESAFTELATKMFGPAHYVSCTKGRAAQMALAACLFRDRSPPTVIAHPMFMSSYYTLERIGARIEHAPRRPGGEATADIDLEWLEKRLAAGGVDLLYLESANNALGGLPLTLSNLEGIARACRSRSVPIVLDATRLLADCCAHGGDLFEAARAYGRLSDAFVVSATKELLVPYGALIGVRDEALQRRLNTYCFLEGSLLTESPQLHAVLVRGMAHLLEHPEIIADRARQLRMFAGALREAGLTVVEPIGGHAVYVRLEAPGLDARAIDERRIEAIALEAHVYQLTGMRAVFLPFPDVGPGVIRLPVTIARYTDDELREAAALLGEAISRAREAPRLGDRRQGPFEIPLADYFTRQPG